MKRSPAPLLIFLAFAALSGWWAIHLYSPASHGPDYPPEYLSLADTVLARGLRSDSTAVLAVTEGDEPSAWLGIARRQDEPTLRAWRTGKPTVIGLHAGDTTFLYWSTPASQRLCFPNGDLTVGIVRRAGAAKVVRLSSPCVKIASITFDFAPR